MLLSINPHAATELNEQLSRASSKYTAPASLEANHSPNFFCTGSWMVEKKEQSCKGPVSGRALEMTSGGIFPLIVGGHL